MIGAALIAGKLLAFDAVAFVACTMSRDHIVNAVGEALLAGNWYAGATAAVLIGWPLMACSVEPVRSAVARWIGRDALAGFHLAMPGLLWSPLQVTVVILYLMHSRLVVKMPPLFNRVYG